MSIQRRRVLQTLGLGAALALTLYLAVEWLPGLLDRPELPHNGGHYTYLSIMAVLLAGRAAELLVFDHLSTGAADDLMKVTEIARAMITRYGMAEDLGQVTYDSEPRGFLDAPMPAAMRERNYSEETAREIDCAVRKLVDRVFRDTRALIERRRDVLERGAKALLEKETLSEDDLRTLGIAPDQAVPRKTLPQRTAAG